MTHRTNGSRTERRDFRTTAGRRNQEQIQQPPRGDLRQKKNRTSLEKIVNRQLQFRAVDLIEMWNVRSPDDVQEMTEPSYNNRTGETGASGTRRSSRIRWLVSF